MKTRNLTLAIAGLVIVASCAPHVNTLVDPQTRYIVTFDEPVRLLDRAKFIEALKKGSWRRDINFTPKQSDDPSPNSDENPLGSGLTETLAIAQDSTVNPNRQHVTQRVGFNAGQRAEIDALLAEVKK